MLTAQCAANTSGNNVTTLMVSIGLIRRYVPAPPAFDRPAARHADEAEEPLAVVGAPPRHQQRSRDHAPLVVHDVQARVRKEDRARIRDDGDHGDLTLLAVRLAQPPD